MAFLLELQRSIHERIALNFEYFKSPCHICLLSRAIPELCSGGNRYFERGVGHWNSKSFHIACPLQTDEAWVGSKSIASFAKTLSRSDKAHHACQIVLNY